MPIVDFLRHGETTSHGTLNGRVDPPLSERGWVQIRGQADGRRWSHVVTSPAQRASAPAREIAQAHGLAPHVDPRFQEMDFGDWDGKTFADLRADPATDAALKRMTVEPESVTPPNGESWDSFTTRIAEGLNELDDNTVVVCHAGVIRAALHVTCGVPLHMLWSLRIGYAVRVQLSIGRGDDGAFWGEIIEIVQP